MKIIGVDPGGTTGVAQLTLNELNPTNTDEHEWFRKEFKGKHHLQLKDFLAIVEPDILLWEKFVYHPNVNAADLISREYIGVMELHLQERRNRPIVHQQYTSSRVKGFWDRKKLDKAQLWIPGSDHANDATKQILVFLESRGVRVYLERLR